MKAFTFELYQILGIFIPLIVTNCVILGRAEAFASKHSVLPSALDGFMMGLGFTLVLTVLGGLREFLGHGTLFANMDLLFGSVATDWTITLAEFQYGFLIAVLPPGAFLITGLLIALKNIIDARNEQRRLASQPAIIAGSKRVRTTGEIA